MAFINGSTEHRVIIEEVDLKEKIRKLDEEAKTCRFCMNLVVKDDVSHYVLKYELIQNLWKQCLPELNINSTVDPMICQNCLQSLELYHTFVENCIFVEETLKKYCGEQTLIPNEKQIFLTRVFDKCKFRLHMTKKRTNVHLKSLSTISDCATNKCDLQTDSSKEQLVIHTDPSNVTIYQCSLCKYKTKDKSHIRRHLLTHKNSSDVTMYQCSFCKFESKHKSSITTHLLIHKDPSELPMYQCNFCTFKSKFKGTVVRHLLKHKDPSEVTMYKCNLCKYESKEKCNLKRHLRTHKDPSEITMYKCNLCMYECKEKSSLRRHLLHTKIHDS